MRIGDALSGRLGEQRAPSLSNSSAWRRAVVGLRVCGGGLFVGLCGLIIQAWSSGAGLTVLAIGVCVYLVSVAIVFSGFIPAVRALPRPRPTLWQLRWILIGDALHW